MSWNEQLSSTGVEQVQRKVDCLTREAMNNPSPIYQQNLNAAKLLVSSERRIWIIHSHLVQTQTPVSDSSLVHVLLIESRAGI